VERFGSYERVAGLDARRFAYAISRNAASKSQTAHAPVPPPMGSLIEESGKKVSARKGAATERHLTFKGQALLGKVGTGFPPEKGALVTAFAVTQIKVKRFHAYY